MNEALRAKIQILRQEVESRLAEMAQDGPRLALGAGPCPGDPHEGRLERERYGKEHDFDGGSCLRCQGLRPGYGTVPDPIQISVETLELILEELDQHRPAPSP